MEDFDTLHCPTFLVPFRFVSFDELQLSSSQALWDETCDVENRNEITSGSELQASVQVKIRR